MLLLLELMVMRLIQFMEGNVRRVGVVGSGSHMRVLDGYDRTYTLALAAISAAKALGEFVDGCRTRTKHPYPGFLRNAGVHVLAPLDHPDPAHCLLSGTGLTHLGSASARDQMHHASQQTEQDLTDSMRMFRWGVEGGKPPSRTPGVQPEWFYKGNGFHLAASGEPLLIPNFGEDGGEEPEIAGLYVVGPDRVPYRLGFCLANEFSDHVMEKRNYLYLAHSKLRRASCGPELRVGSLPERVTGLSRIHRGDEVVFEREFLSGEAHMCHSLENLEFHHFKYNLFRQPGDVHVHFLGTATLSVAEGIVTKPGDLFEIVAPAFGEPLRNPLAVEPASFQPGEVRAL